MEFQIVSNSYCDLHDPNSLFKISQAFHIAQNYIIHVPLNYINVDLWIINNLPFHRHTKNYYPGAFAWRLVYRLKCRLKYCGYCSTLVPIHIITWQCLLACAPGFRDCLEISLSTPTTPQLWTQIPFLRCLLLLCNSSWCNESEAC